MFVQPRVQLRKSMQSVGNTIFGFGQIGQGLDLGSIQEVLKNIWIRSIEMGEGVKNAEGCITRDKGLLDLGSASIFC